MVDKAEFIRRCERLVSAFLFQAVTDHQIAVRDFGISKAMHHEPALWLMSNDKSPYKFLWCCMILDLNPEALRNKMNDLSLIPDAIQHLKNIGVSFVGRGVDRAKKTYSSRINSSRHKREAESDIDLE